MERADAALYRAKASGRRRFSVASAEARAGSSHEQGTTERHELNVQNTVTALARALDARNGYSHLHSHAVAHYAAALGQALRMDAERVDSLRRAGVLHDVGKIGMPDAILWKAEPLTEEEIAVVHRHSQIGHDILVGAGLPDIAGWVRHLHERFDGAGYPDGLAGARIPMESRVLKVADALDAMLSPRLYRAPLGVREALAELERGAGGEFDPEVVVALLDLARSGDLQLDGGERRDGRVDGTTVPD
jgi:HD-GYP domain-containing protein (c-di-GMP phosphodiesterase class II)